ncbi:MAG: capsule biosynthesis protein [Kofleriaceae bacterium]
MRVLFFSPHAGIWPHSFPEALVADAIRNAPADLIYITCDGALGSFCVTMAAQGLTARSDPGAKHEVCDRCRTARDRLRRGFHFPGYDFETVLTDVDRMRIEALLDEADPAALASFEVDGIAVGRAALYEFLIERKKTQLALTEEEWGAFRPRLANTLRSSFAASRILDREAPDRVVVYNSLYSVNAMWRLHAAARGIPFYFVHGGLGLVDRLQHVVVGRDTTLEFWNRIIAAWPRYRALPCNRAELAHVTDHFLQLFRGTSVFAYSAPKSQQRVDVRGRFGVGADQKLVFATMSSYDEYVAAAAVGGAPDPASLLFPTQLAWVRALVSWFEARPELFLVLRVHPREFPNKREGLKSEHARQLEKALVDLPANVKVNWPTDQLSIYDLAEEGEVVLNGWSSAGKEMTLLGLPVVTYCPTVMQYPPELNYVGTTEPAYFAAIERALADGWSFERTRAAYRWCVLEFLRGLVSIEDGFAFSEEAPRTLTQRLRNAVFAQPVVRQTYDVRRRPEHLGEEARLCRLVTGAHATLLDVPAAPREVVSEDRETELLRGELRRLMEALYPEPANGQLSGLRARLAGVVA